MGRQLNVSTVTEHYAFTDATRMAKELPHLFKPISDLPGLSSEERENLAQCEAAVETLKWSFWLAGKALQIIRDARLYRATHATFEDYTLDRWDMQSSYARKLIRTWRIAEALFEREASGALPAGTTKTINQAQMWELVSVADAWTVEPATFVYRTLVQVAAADDTPVTAQILKGAVKALPLAAPFDETAAETAIVDYMTGADRTRPEPDPAHRVRRALKDWDEDAVRRAITDPDTRARLRRLLALLDEYEAADSP